jgi:hypothetical protein
MTKAVLLTDTDFNGDKLSPSLTSHTHANRHFRAKTQYCAPEGMRQIPLRLAFFFAVASIGLATLVGVYAIVGWMLAQTVQGWTSLLLMFVLFSSVQLICISIVGEYVGRTYMQTKQRPLYVVKAVYAQSQPRQFEIQYSANNP